MWLASTDEDSSSGDDPDYIEDYTDDRRRYFSSLSQRPCPRYDLDGLMPLDLPPPYTERAESHAPPPSPLITEMVLLALPPPPAATPPRANEPPNAIEMPRASQPWDTIMDDDGDTEMNQVLSQQMPDAVEEAVIALEQDPTFAAYLRAGGSPFDVNMPPTSVDLDADELLGE